MLLASSSETLEGNLSNLARSCYLLCALYFHLLDHHYNSRSQWRRKFEHEMFLLKSYFLFKFGLRMVVTGMDLLMNNILV